MQLTYCGQPSETSATVIDAIATGETATFIGCPYARKQFTVAQRQQPTELPITASAHLLVHQLSPRRLQHSSCPPAVTSKDFYWLPIA